MKEDAQIIAIEHAGGLVNGELGHSIGILYKDVLNRLSTIFGAVELNPNKLSNADLLVDDVISRAESVGVGLVAESPHLIIISAVPSAFQLLQTPLLLLLDQLNIPISLFRIHNGSRISISLACVIAAYPFVENRYSVALLRLGLLFLSLRRRGFGGGRGAGGGHGPGDGNAFGSMNGN